MDDKTQMGLVLSSFIGIGIGVLKILLNKFNSSNCKIGGLSIQVDQLNQEIEVLKNIVNQSLKEVIIEQQQPEKQTTVV